MKPILLIYCLAVFSLGASAQSHTRLKAVASYTIHNGSFQLQDTIAYQYSSGRGSRQKFTLSQYTDVLKKVADWKGMPYEDIRFDTSTEFLLSGEIRRIYNTYNAAGSVTETVYKYYYSNISYGFSRSLNTYNGNNLLVQQLYQFWNDTLQVWQNSSRELRSYDGNNQLTGHLDQNWDPVLLWINYSKDSIGWIGGNPVYIIGGTWVNGNSWNTSLPAIYHYDLQDHMDSMYAIIQTNPLYTLYHRYWYSGSNPVLLKHGSSAGPLTIVKDSSIFDANGNRLLTFEQNFNYSPAQWIYSRRTVFTYNSNNQATLQTVSFLDTATNTFRDSMLTRYYYESYTPTGIKSIAAQPQVLLMPNPASDYLHLTINSAEPAGYNISIIDVSGKLMTQYTTSAKKVYSTDIDVRRFAAGEYFLIIRPTAGEVMTYRFVVNR